MKRNIQKSLQLPKITRVKVKKNYVPITKTNNLYEKRSLCKAKIKKM